MEELKDLREKIDAIDQQMVDLFKQRMGVSKEVAAYKRANGLPTLDAGRERALLGKVGEQAGEELADYTQSVYRTILAAGRSYQNACSGVPSKVYETIRKALDTTPDLFPQRAMVACQGVEGAYSQIACDSIFKAPTILYFNTFEHVFKAVESGMCQYGVLPIENSTAGSVNAIYDLMTQHNFSIVRSARLKVNHNLLTKHGVKKEEIKEIFSHQQAISQCGRFLQSLPGVTVVRCENTAVAAKRVAESGRADVAALSSRACVGLYGLESLASSVQDQGNNYTRFICIAKDLEIYPGADRTSLMMVLPHKPGSLYKVLSRFYALGINLNKLESRPLPERDFEFMFYFDLETSVYSPQFQQLMGELPGLCEEFSYLGSYREVV